MKAEKTFVGAVAILISIGASGCAGTTMSTFQAEHGGTSGGAVASVAAPYVPERPTPVPERAHHFGSRVSHMRSPTATALRH